MSSPVDNREAPEGSIRSIDSLRRGVESGVEGALQGRAPDEGGATAAPALAFEEASLRFEGDLQLMRVVLEAFLQHAPTVIRRIGAAVDADDREGLRSAGHELRGSAANVGAAAIRDLAASLELGGASSAVGELRVTSRALEEELERLRLELDSGPLREVR